jgi:hypothetical protein
VATCDVGESTHPNLDGLVLRWTNGRRSAERKVIGCDYHQSGKLLSRCREKIHGHRRLRLSFLVLSVALDLYELDLEIAVDPLLMALLVPVQLIAVSEQPRVLGHKLRSENSVNTIRGTLFPFSAVAAMKCELIRMRGAPSRVARLVVLTIGFEFIAGTRVWPVRAELGIRVDDKSLCGI